MERSHGYAPLSLLFVLFNLATLAACASVTAPPSYPAAQPAPAASVSPPASHNESAETKVSRSLVREQEGRLAVCSLDRSCDRAHFTRALLYLSENQGLAAKHFQEVVAIAPRSPLASLSVSWLKLLKDPPEVGQDAVFAQTTQWLIRDLWSREQGLKEELSTRDRKLEALSAQLEALKQIDLEMAEKPHPLRPKMKFNPRSTQQQN